MDDEDDTRAPAAREPGSRPCCVRAAPTSLRRSGLEPRRDHAPALAGEYRREGDDETAAALLEAIAPKRGRGRPREWSDAQILNLAVDVGEVLRANHRLTGTRAIAVVAELPQWRGWAASTLRSRFTDRFAAYNDLSFDQAVEVLRGSPRPAD
jgi:hypothetical protein